MVAGIECVGGAMLVIGLFTRLWAALLIGVTVTVPVSVIAGAYTYRHFQALSRVS